MKKLFITVSTFLACGTAYALPVGNPSDASLLCDGLIWEAHCGDPCDPCLRWWDAFSVRVGFYGDYVFNRYMEVDERSNDSDIEHTKIYTSAGFIAANFWDRFDIFVTLGATNIFIETNDKAFGLGGSGRFELETEMDFSWSIGFRGSIWECGHTTLGAEAQYFYTKPHITRGTDDASVSVYPGSHVNAKYHEWQIGVGIAHRINLFVPYIAIKWSDSKLKLGNASLLFPEVGTASLSDLKSKKGLGYAVGVSLIDCEKASLTVEGRWAGEKGVYVNGQIRI